MAYLTLQQETEWVSDSLTSGGSCSLQISIAKEQRGQKRQPGGKFNIDGG